MAQVGESPQKGLKRAASLQSNLFANFVYDEHYSGTLCYGLLYFEEAPSMDALRKMMTEQVIPAFPRFRSVVKRDEKKQIYFEEVDEKDIDLDYHIVSLFEDKEVKVVDLLDWVGEQYGLGMDIKRPLWRILRVPNLDDGRSVMVWQIDHCIGDGSALREVMYYSMDPPDEKLVELAKSRPKKRVNGPSMTLTRYVYYYMAGIIEGLTMLTQRSDTPNNLKVKDVHNVSKKKSLAATEGISLEEVKEIKNSFAGATVNDVAMTILTLTVQKYLEDNSPGFTHDDFVRGNYPVDMREPGKPLDHLGNDISFSQMKFHFKYENSVDLLWKVKGEMDYNKVSPAAALTKWLVTYVIGPILPVKLQLDLMLILVGKVSAMLSNVAGPQIAVSLMGHKLDNMEIYAQSEIGLYFGLFSYDGKVTGTVTLDGENEPNAAKLTKHWAPEFKRFVQEVREYKEKNGVDVIYPPQSGSIIDNPNATTFFVAAVFVMLAYFMSLILM